MPKVTREHEERRRGEILRAALTCFARQGYHRTTMDRIVAEAGLSKGALYQYFPGKEALFLALHRKQDEELRARLEQAFSGGTSVREKLERGAQVFLVALKAEYGELARISLEFWSEAPRRPDLGEKFRKSYGEWREFLSRIIAEGIRTGEFRADLDPRALASVILGVCDGLTLHWVVHGGRLDLQKVSAAFLLSLFEGTVLRGKGRRPRARKAAQA